ncbi:MAG: DUF898 family protein, partial [Pseudomonadota bacterium]
GYALTFVGVIPIWFFASYRAQRYLLARTRWMGLRFGLAPGAWGYALRACWHWGLTLLTLGAWHPRLRWSLARYRHDRTYFGTQKMAQGGDALMLYPAFVHVLIGGVLTLGCLAISAGDVGAFVAALEAETPETLDPLTPFWRMLLISVPWLFYGLVHYSVEGRRALIGALGVGDVRLAPAPRVGRMLWIVISGNLARYFGTVIVVFFAVLVLVAIAASSNADFSSLASGDDFSDFSGLFQGLPRWVPFAIVALFYFTLFLIWNTFTHLFLNLPTWRHYAETMRLGGTGHLADIAQRARDESREAGGFAEALDVGAAI